MLLNDVEKILEKADFEYLEYKGCFDIIAKKDFVLLLKVLTNVDSFQYDQANNLKILSNNLHAFSALVGLHTRYDKLNDSIIYDRFGISTFNTKTLETILQGSFPFIQRFRGGLFVEINSDELKKKRVNAGLTQEELADKVGVTKKSVYEHEKKRIKARYEIVLKMESILGKVSEPVKLNYNFSDVKNNPKDRFEGIVCSDLAKMGFETNLIYQTPFNIIAKKEQFLVFSDAEEKEESIRKRVPYMLSFSDITKKPVFIVTKKEVELDLPSLKESDLREMNSKELKRILKR